ncbi:hypothetical protein B0H19DRAFT_1088142 [Mycena capillaripes]|nr:hypothetical protein B0H19DRAFT_1088142 [Mycena capillaripes]
MLSLSAAKQLNAAFLPAYLPVAVFVGGTSGVGRATTEAFAHYTKGNAHIIIVGRNKGAAESSTPTGWKDEFNIGAVMVILLKRVPKINFLVASSGDASLLGRHERRRASITSWRCGTMGGGS